MYHWLFVPLTLGLGFIMAIHETYYYRTKDEKWKSSAKFWQKIFGINFAVGVATGIILEFEFGTNWSNYSWFVGDIFGAPLAIEGIFAFFMEATFIAVMFFGWNKVSRGFHLASTWLTIGGATLSAVWILVANAWMQHPVGIGETAGNINLNPDMVRTELLDFWAVISPIAIVKFLHTVISSWMLGASVVIGISSWYLLKKRNVEFALDSIKIASVVGIVGIVISVITGDTTGNQVAKTQPMKLAAMEGLYDGGEGIGLVGAAILKPGKVYNDGTDPYYFDISLPKMLSFLATRDFNGYVPGINDIIKGYGNELPVAEKIAKGKAASAALKLYHNATDADVKAVAKADFEKDKKYFGYSFFKDASELIPPVGLVFYSFRIMVCLGFAFLLLFIITLYFSAKNKFADTKWLQKTCIWAIPFAYIASQAGWIVAEVGRQPWAIQDILPVNAAVSNIGSASVIITFFIFLILFTTLLVAELRIMFNAIKKGPEKIEN